jgi:hypothetical protein
MLNRLVCSPWLLGKPSRLQRAEGTPHDRGVTIPECGLDVFRNGLHRTLHRSAASSTKSGGFTALFALGLIEHGLPNDEGCDELCD